MRSQQNFRREQVGEVNYTVEMNTIQNSCKSFMFDQERKKLTEILKEFEQHDKRDQRAKQQQQMDQLFVKEFQRNNP